MTHTIASTCRLLTVIALLGTASLRSMDAHPVSTPDNDSTRQTNVAGRTITHVLWNDVNDALAHGMRLGSMSAYDDHSEWTYVGVALGATAAAFAVDDGFRSMIARQRGSTMRDLTATGDFFGSWGSPIIASGFYLVGLVSGDEWTRVTGRLALEAFLYAGATTSVIKSLAGRSRPYTETGPFDYHPLQFNTERTSLPSGHSTMAWAFAGVLEARIDHPVATIVLFGIALSTMGHRWYNDQHWLSDSILGAAIGWGIGRAVVAMEESRDKETRVLLLPIVAPESAGLQFVVQW